MKKILVINFAVVLLNFTCKAQWQKTNGPVGGGWIRCLTMNGQNVIAGMQGGGIYKSSNNGASWQGIYDNVPDPTVNALAVIGSTIFASLSIPLTGNGIYASTDNGLTWNLRNIGITNTTPMSAIAASGSTLYTGIVSGPLYTSTNNAISWTPVNTGLPAMTGISVLCAVGNTVLAGAYPSGLYRSTTNGTSLVSVPTGLAQNSKITCFAVSGSTIFAGVTQNTVAANCVLMSTDNGSSWTAVGAGINFTSVGSLTVIGSTLFAATAAGVFMTTNNGLSWTAMNTGLTDLNVEAITGDNTQLFAATNSGMFVSLNNGLSWNSCNNGIVNTAAKPLIAVGNDVFVGIYGSFNTGVYKTGDTGNTWTSLNTGLTGEVSVLAASGGSMYAGTRMQGIFLSTNNGASWSPVNNGLTGNAGILNINDIAIKGNNMFAALYGGSFYKSSNGGLSWTVLNLGGTGPVLASCVAVKGNTVFAGTAGGGLYASADDGATWTLRPLPIPGGTWIWTIKINGSRMFLGVLSGNSQVSADDGYTWTSISNSGLPNRINSFAFDSDTTYAATWDQGVFKSVNNGASWVNFSSGLCNLYIWDLLVKDRNLYASAYTGGVFKIGLSVAGPVDTTTVHVAIPENNQELSGITIYPNPFSSSATLSFGDGFKAGTVKISDAFGREVMSKRFSGKTLEVEKGNLTAGVYFITVSSENGPTERKKIIIH